jgi:hypothetical protein
LCRWYDDNERERRSNFASGPLCTGPIRAPDEGRASVDAGIHGVDQRIINASKAYGRRSYDFPRHPDTRSGATFALLLDFGQPIADANKIASPASRQKLPLSFGPGITSNRPRHHDIGNEPIAVPNLKLRYITKVELTLSVVGADSFGQRLTQIVNRLVPLATRRWLKVHRGDYCSTFAGQFVMRAFVGVVVVIATFFRRDRPSQKQQPQPPRS